MMVGSAELADAKTGRKHYSIDWAALHLLFTVAHDAVMIDPAPLVVEAMLTVRNTLNEPAVKRLTHHTPDDDG